MPLSQRTRKLLLTLFLLLAPVLVGLMLYYAVKAPSSPVPTIKQGPSR